VDNLRLSRGSGHYNGQMIAVSSLLAAAAAQQQTWVLQQDL
jgi:hypothetical protein